MPQTYSLMFTPTNFDRVDQSIVISSDFLECKKALHKFYILSVIREPNTGKSKTRGLVPNMTIYTRKNVFNICKLPRQLTSFETKLMQFNLDPKELIQ